ncbi:hypothetical protein E1293_28170 [Actinomadura darangshiensis]|uniref:PE domain-containing protein n=1 Tax=Actinomadura darangshiensis TaxID=705336 RepID=A0A4R5AVE4_9ACTN|nr:hypothetical protein [Actinomadura darangshiensis]TDD75656.1 hypothetical protein E1293_28170 [Actinomadura darangshiensis]
MGMPGYEVDPEGIRSSGIGIGTSAQQLKSDWEAFQAELAGFGEPWGDDDIGSLIGGCYQAIYEVAAECYGDNLQAMEEDAGVVQYVADSHAAAEQHNVVEINRVRDVLG